MRVNKLGFRKLLHNYYTTITGNYYTFFSYITGSTYNVIVVIVNFPHVGENNSHDFFMYIPLKSSKNYYTLRFSLGNSEENCNIWCNTRFWYIANSTYGTAKIFVIVKCNSFLTACNSFPKIGGAFN